MDTEADPNYDQYRASLLRKLKGGYLPSIRTMLRYKLTVDEVPALKSLVERSGYSKAATSQEAQSPQGK